MKEKIKKHKFKIFLGIATLAIVGLFTLNTNNLNNQVENKAANLSISSKEGSFIINQSFSVLINVDAKFRINAADATLNFNPDILEVENISKENSIFNLWPQEPSFSNASGTIEFAGVLPNPGYEGVGQILTITFRPKKIGQAEINFTDASVLANDGKGTDILKEKTGAVYSIKVKEPIQTDLNNDGKVNLTDVSIMISYWGKKYKPEFDLNQDGKIDLVDLSILLNKVEKR